MFARFIFFIFLCFFSHGRAEFFPAERIALDFNLVNLAESILNKHYFDTFPKGAEARSLLAKIAFLKGDFKESYRYLQLSIINEENYAIYAFSQTFLQKNGSIVPLFEPKDVLSKLLTDWIKILNFPINFPKWANFWWDLRKFLALPTYEFLYHLAVEIKIRQMGLFNEGSFFKDNLLTFIPILFTQKRFEQLKVLLESVLAKQENTIEEQSHYLFWFFRVKKELNETFDDAVLKILKQNVTNIRLLEFVFSEWLQSVPDLKQRVKGLKNFLKLYKRKQNLFYCHYLSILLINCYIELGQNEQAKKDLLKILKTADKTFLSYAYELLAKNECFKSIPDYRCAANFLEEVKNLELNPNRLFFLEKLQAELYTLLGEYDRAYCIYQELLFKDPAHFLGSKIAYEWCLCGILCKESEKELEQQLNFCRSYRLLTSFQEEQIALLFAKHQFELGNFAKVLQYFESFESNETTIKEKIKLLRAKCLIKLNAYDKAEQILKTIVLRFLSLEDCADYYLWSAQVFCFMDSDDEAQNCLDWFQTAPVGISQQTHFQAILLRAQLSAKQHAFVQAKQLLLNACQQTKDVEWIPIFKMQAADYAEECGLEGQLEAIQILQSIYEDFPKHSLAKDARLKQGLLLLNIKHYDLAYTIFESLLPKLGQEQALWCRFLMIKCNLLSQKMGLKSIQDQLEFLLKESMPIGLRLEIVLQLAYIYKDQNNLEAVQEILWNTCYPFFEERDDLSLSVNEIYWLSRCLLVLAQYSSDKDVAHQIYTWMVDAQLPNASLVQQYLED